MTFDREALVPTVRQVFREFNDDADQIFNSDEWAARMIDAIAPAVEQQIKEARAEALKEAAERGGSRRKVNRPTRSN